MKRIMLHICCAPCSAHTVDVLKEEFEVAGYFYNPNIQPEDEYMMRLNELKRFADRINLEVFEGEYNVKEWNELTKGHEEDREGAERCNICYKMRLERCAEFANRIGIEYFSTVLSVSPHKNAETINSIGSSLAKTYGLNFFEADFKKKDGFKLSVQKGKEHGLIRQNYCGCRYSKNLRN